MALCETRTTFPVRDGYLLTGDASTPARYGDDERKMAIWSATELEPVEFDSGIDRTRFVAARTETSIGTVLILAICIPWHMAEVTYHEGVKRRPWELHHSYLEHLNTIIRDAIIRNIDEPVVIAGDFNQRYPRVKGGNIAAAQALESTFQPFDIVTAGIPKGCNRPGIDHIALSPHLQATDVGGWPNDVGGKRLSDHDGVWATVGRSL